MAGVLLRAQIFWNFRAPSISYLMVSARGVDPPNWVAEFTMHKNEGVGCNKNTLNRRGNHQIQANRQSSELGIST